MAFLPARRPVLLVMLSISDIDVDSMNSWIFDSHALEAIFVWRFPNWANESVSGMLVPVVEPDNGDANSKRLEQAVYDVLAEEVTLDGSDIVEE